MTLGERPTIVHGIIKIAKQKTTDEIFSKGYTERLTPWIFPEFLAFLIVRLPLKRQPFRPEAEGLLCKLYK